MQRLISWYRDATQAQDNRIPALDGLRALMVLIIVSFHIWQQSWLTPVIPWFGGSISLDFLLRSGYIWVDGLLLLSGFLLYLPWAQRGNKPAPSTGTFYRRRFFRIVPTYLFNLLVVFLVVALPEKRFATPWAATRDILAHVTFTHNLFPFSYLNTPLNGALWTLAVEVQFYLLFPLLARAFRRMPVLTYIGMAGIAFGYRAWAGTLPDSSLYFNQLPAFLDVYANGFVAAGIYVSMRRLKEDGWSRVLMTVCAGLALYGLLVLCRAQAAEKAGELIRRGQMNRRFLLSVLLSVLMLGTSLGLGGVRLLLGNKVTRVLSEISFQLYMWHQVLAVQLRTWGIPAHDNPFPNQLGDRVWQRSYVLLCYLGALIISVLVTYLIEQPVARRFSGRARIPKST